MAFLFENQIVSSIGDGRLCVNLNFNGNVMNRHYIDFERFDEGYVIGLLYTLKWERWMYNRWVSGIGSEVYDSLLVERHARSSMCDNGVDEYEVSLEWRRFIDAVMLEEVIRPCAHTIYQSYLSFIDCLGDCDSLSFDINFDHKGELLG